jgi:hypothetical protein
MITAIHLLRQLEIGNPAEHNNVLASYAILQATGRLSVKQLGLQVAKYEPEEHYNAVKATETICAHRSGSAHGFLHILSLRSR